MKKYLITSVLVGFCLLFLVGCSSEDGSHNHDHDHDLLHDHNLVLEEEVGSNKTLEERFKLVKVGMTFEEVKFVMGFPYRIKSFVGVGHDSITFLYTLDPEDTSGEKVDVFRIAFHSLKNLVTSKRIQLVELSKA